MDAVTCGMIFKLFDLLLSFKLPPVSLLDRQNFHGFESSSVPATESDDWCAGYKVTARTFSRICRMPFLTPVYRPLLDQVISQHENIHPGSQKAIYGLLGG